MSDNVDVNYNTPDFLNTTWPIHVDH